MRMLIVQPYGDRLGHFGEYTTRVCQALARIGHDIVLSTNKIDVAQVILESPLFEIAQLPGDSYRYYPRKKKVIGYPFAVDLAKIRNNVAVMSATLRLLERRRFDAMLIMNHELVSTWWVMSRTKVRLPLTAIEIMAANFAFDKYPGSIARRLWKLLQRKALKKMLGRQVKGILVEGEWHAQELPKQLGLRDGSVPIYSVPHASDVPASPVPCTAARGKIGLGEFRATVFLFFGMLRRDKGLDYLLRAAAATRGNFRLLIAGAPHDWNRRTLEELVKTLGIQDKVILRVKYIPNEEVSFYFYASDAVIFPYARMYTGSAGPLMRVCAHARPLIVSKVADIGRVVQENNLGLVAEPSNAESLSRALQAFVEMPEQTRREFGHNALRLAQKSSWEDLARHYVQAYEIFLRN